MTGRELVSVQGGSVAVLLAEIANRPDRVRVDTPSARPAAVATVLRGIVDWLTDEPTLEAQIVEDVARMIERCDDGEELRDLAVQIRQLMFSFEPDAGRVAMTELEARVLHLFRAVQ